MPLGLHGERLRVTGLAHRYGERVALDGLSFHVAPGEVVGLLGPNGSGKSTALSVLCGLEVQQAGEVRLDGAPVAGGARALLAQTGVVFQAPSLDDRLTARQNLALAARLRALPRSRTPDIVAAALDRARLADRADEAVGRLSGGMKRRLDIARATLHEPSLLLLDEPTAGLDEASFRATWDHLEAVRRERAVSILVSTHRADEAERCDRVVVLAGGRAATVATPAELRARVAHDLILLTGPDPAGLRDAVAALGLPASVALDGATVRIACERGHELVPRIVEALPEGRLASVSLRHPSLADVFLALTGGALDEEPLREAA